MERIAVIADYEVKKHGELLTGRVEFVARIADPAKGFDLVARAQRAVARRLTVREADVKIVGLLSI